MHLNTWCVRVCERVNDNKKRQRETKRKRANEAYCIELKITRVKIVKPTRDEGFRFSLLFLRKIESDLEIAIAVIFQLHTCIIFDFAKGKTTLLVFASCCCDVGGVWILLGQMYSLLNHYVSSIYKIKIKSNSFMDCLLKTSISLVFMLFFLRTHCHQ